MARSSLLGLVRRPPSRSHVAWRPASAVCDLSLRFCSVVRHKHEQQPFLIGTSLSKRAFVNCRTVCSSEGIWSHAGAIPPGGLGRVFRVWLGSATGALYAHYVSFFSFRLVNLDFEVSATMIFIARDRAFWFNNSSLDINTLFSCNMYHHFMIFIIQV